MTGASKFMSWASVLGLSMFAIIRGLPPRVRADARSRAVVSHPPATAPVAAPQQKLMVIHETAGQGPLPEFIDGGSFDVTTDHWSDLCNAPRKAGEWRDAPGLPKDVLELRELIHRHYTCHFSIWPPSQAPNQLEFMVNGQWNRHGFTPLPGVPDFYFGQIDFVRYRATGVTGNTVIVRRYWTLGRTPDSVKPDR